MWQPTFFRGNSPLAGAADLTMEVLSDDECRLSSAVLGGLPRTTTRTLDDPLPDLYHDPDCHRAGSGIRQHLSVELPWQHERDHRGGWRLAVPRPTADDPLPAEVPALVVRLEPGTVALHEPGDGIRRAHGRPLSIHGRGAVGAPGFPLPGRAAGIEQMAAAGQVVPRNPSLRGTVLPGYRGLRGGHHHLVCHSLHGPLPESPVRLCRGRH